MTLTAGTRLGPYEIVGALGAGGMGEVYRARDTKLGREVALKVLPQEFAADAERMARFEREAKVLASLNHPNIASIYGFEDSSGEGTPARALVMELVEGQTLAELIASEAKGARAGMSEPRGAIPIDEALPIAKQIAEGLEYAHERGIVHRDLKPANVKITPDGVVKILDFGLAKALEGDTAVKDPSSSPTMSRLATQAGIILGTAAYMSPEQAKGKTVDRRTDIWAFGCVLYEMLTGKPAFGGETGTDILAAVVRDEPDWGKLPKDTPTHVRVLLQRCMQRDPKQRLRDIGDARIALDEVLSGAAKEIAASTGVATPIWRRVLPWALAGLLATALVAVGVKWEFAAPAPQARMHFRAVTNFAGVQADPALSPDGRSVAFVSERDGHYNIYVGLLGGGNLVQITNDPNLKSRPSWSPDGTTLAYGRLDHSGIWDVWEAPALGGTPRRVILNAKDPAWSPDGHSLAYENGANHAIWLSGISGEGAHQIAGTAGPLWHDTDPRFSPDGRQLAFIDESTGPYGELEVLDVASQKVRQLTHDDALALSPAWSPDGRFVYFASSRGGTMNIWKIAAGGGEPEQITSGQGDDAQLDVSSDGKRIVFSTWRTNVNIAQADLTAKSEQQSARLLTTDPVRNQMAPAYSPDGKHITYFSNLKGAENESIWIANADGSNPVQLVRDSQVNVFPLWTPDSQHVVYRAEPAGGSTADEYRIISASGGVPETMLKNATGDYFDIESDGRLLFTNFKDEVETFDPRDNQTRILGQLHGNRLWASSLRLSPDGRFIAYVVPASREDDPNAGLWVTDFKSSPRQIFRGWVVQYARGPQNEIYVLEGRPDLNGVLWKVGWNGQGLERTPVTIPLVHSYWVDPSQNSQDYFDISPDGSHVAFEKQTILSSNIGMIENLR
ncbi:MAG: PD40 domain-containing protein [Acidobacteriota bacterium]|nr:PD40 domain-containing protein [Acidobacteriota bacterium]